jgi:WD40 repeat protein
VIGACRCGDAEVETTSAASRDTERARLALGEDVTTLRAPALALAWLGDGPVIGQRGALMLGGRELSAPAYLGGAISARDGVVHAWPYELRDETPTELAVPEGPPIVTARATSRGWLALRNTPDARELVRLDDAAAHTIAQTPGATTLAIDDDRVAAVGTRAWLVEGDRTRELSAPRYEARTAAFVGDRLVALDATGALVVWDLATGTTTTLVAHLGAASALDVRDAYLATGGSDGRIAVWRVADLPTSAASATEPFAEATFAGTVDALVWIDDATLAAAVTEGRRSRVVRLRLRDRR